MARSFASSLIGTRGVLLAALLLLLSPAEAFDPWMCCAKCLSSWRLVQYQMGSMIIWYSVPFLH